VLTTEVFEMNARRILLEAAGIAGALMLAGAAALAAKEAAPAAVPAQPVTRVSSILSGTWQGDTPGNGLMLRVTGVGRAPTAVRDRLYVSVLGKYQGVNVQQQGILHLESQGTGAFATYLPLSNPARTPVSPNVRRDLWFNPSANCQVDFLPLSDGYGGDTISSAQCAQAIRGAAGRWSVQLDSGRLMLRNVHTGATLLFRKIDG
jgi:hypothetical protein